MSVLAVETAVLTLAAGPGMGAVHQVCAPWDLLRQMPGFYYTRQISIPPCPRAQRLKS